MDRNVKFMECLWIDVTSCILSCLDDPADLIRASAVSRTWNHFVIADGLCKKLCLRKVLSIANITSVVEENDGTIAFWDTVLRNPTNWKTLQMEHKIYSSLLKALAIPVISPKECIAFVIGASSTDRDPAENVINTLAPDDRHAWGCSYWSSKGQSDPNVPESIIYRLKTSICKVTEIHIRPFEAFWEAGNPVYSAKYVRFRMGGPKSVADLEMDARFLQPPSINKYVWTYTSPKFPMKQESCLQQFKLPDPVVCVGGFLQIELLGRAQREEIDGLFYICLGHVKVLGCPLEPAFNLEMFPSGELQLTYRPDVLDLVIQNFSNEVAQPVSEEEDAGPEDPAERLRLLGALVPLEIADEIFD